MQRLEWVKEYEIGINVIDEQHRRIVEYINTLADLDSGQQEDELPQLIDSLVDYTYSHFAFEEALMEEAGYEFLNVHQRTHEAFTQRINDLHQRFKSGEDVSEELGELLLTWLINHIQSDDQSYATLVRKKFSVIERKEGGNWLSRNLRRFFQ